MINPTTIVAVLSAMLPLGADRPSEVVIEWVHVKDPGNVGESAGEGAGGYGPDRICGAVDYEYRIAKYEVTNGQYIALLNAVAAVSDANGLYSAEMAGTHGGIVRTGSGTTKSPWVYAPKDGDRNWTTRPVCFVNFHNALRFANWMHNGRPTGAQDAGTTEDGAYDMSLGERVVRKDGARVFLPSEDEWYKAAFYKGGGTKAGYWDFATQSDALPVAEPPPGRAEPPGSANYENEKTGLSVGPPYYTTPVGAYTHSPSAYGTFDQTGNMNEWVEDRPYADQAYRSILGGAWFTWGKSLHAAMRHKNHPSFESKVVGFRLASVLPDTVGRDATVASSAEVQTVRLTERIYRITLSFGLRSNTGVSAGPDGVLVVDTGESPVAQRLKAAVEALEKGSPKYIVNTHLHRDHIGGNDVLGAGATVIQLGNLQQRVAEGVLTCGQGPLRGESGRTFDAYYSMNFNGEEIRLIPTPGAHSDADLLVHFTGSGVVQTGDLLLSQSFPAVPHAVKGYLEILDTMIDVFPHDTRFIPGHGRDCTMEGVEQYRAMLRKTIEVIKKEMKAGKGVEEMRRENVLERWESWGEFLPFLGTDYWIAAVHDNYAAESDRTRP